MSVQLTTAQLKALGMGDYTSPQRREVLMERIGKVVFDGAMVRLLASLNESQMHALNHAIESCDSFMCVIAHVERVYPQFTNYLEEEQAAFIQAYVAQLEAAR